MEKSIVPIHRKGDKQSFRNTDQFLYSYYMKNCLKEQTGFLPFSLQINKLITQNKCGLQSPYSTI